MIFSAIVGAVFVFSSLVMEFENITTPTANMNIIPKTTNQNIIAPLFTSTIQAGEQSAIGASVLCSTRTIVSVESQAVAHLCCEFGFRDEVTESSVEGAHAAAVWLMYLDLVHPAILAAPYQTHLVAHEAALRLVPDNLGQRLHGLLVLGRTHRAPSRRASVQRHPRVSAAFR